MFEGKTILDVGTGSGVLSLWAAQAGAAKVYAVEYTDMAIHARKMVEANGMSHIIEVIQSSVEELELPCKVDIVISEWMGYFLYYESMLDTVLYARDRYLAPGGLIFPDKATMMICGIEDGDYKEEKIGCASRARAGRAGARVSFTAASPSRPHPRDRLSSLVVRVRV
jgi:protein arginine N-methyltransferase 1